MALTVLGANHRTAPIAVREKFAIGPEAIDEAVAMLRQRTGAYEAVLLSTCNRTELYVVHGSGDPGPETWNALSERLGAPAAPYGYVHRDREAVAHLFRVASGMDSMILGEAQIHGQVRRAWESSRAQSGAVLNRLFQTSLSVASRVRTETSVSRGAASVSSASVLLAKKIFASLQGRRAMILGAGDVAELALECLVSEGVRAAMVANRTFERASRLAAEYGAVAVHYEDCWQNLHEVDVLICSTAAPHIVVTPDDVRHTLARRGDRPLCILDIALPRDVDPDVGTLDNVFLYDIDDLRAVVASNIERRQESLPFAESLVSGETDRFWSWYSTQAAVPALTHFRAEMDRLRERELAQAMRRLAHLPDADRDAIAHFSRTLMNKFLHAPTVRLREAAAAGDPAPAIDALRQLFALEAGTPAGEQPVSTAPQDVDADAPAVVQPPRLTVLRGGR